MPEEVSPESKLYVKEEIEKSRKEIKEEVEKVNSKATKTFTTVAIVIGLVTGLGVYGSATHYISTSIQDKLGAETMAEFEARIIQANQFVIAAKDLVDDANNHVEGAKKLYNDIADIEARAQSILLYKMIIGTIVPYGGKIEDSEEPTEVEEGWFFCNGATLKRNDYPLLFKVIGKAFGEPNDSTFNLPDLHGRFVRGVDHGQKRDPDARLRTASNKGGHTGDKVGSVQEDALGSHSHPLETPTPIYEHYRSFQGSGDGSDKPLKTSIGSRRSKKWTPKIRASVGNETRPKNIYVNWIIKAR
jgi:hypothetical protein